MLIWVVNIDLFVLENIDNPQWLFLLSTLTSDESDKVQRFHYFDDKKRAILSLLLQKAVIRKFCNLKDNQSFEIRRTVEGKPFPIFKNEETELVSISSVLANNWNYNVSHHGQYVSIISASKILVGVDIVDILTRSRGCNSSREYISVFESQLHPFEYSEIMSHPNEDGKYTRFFIYWALKESYIKAVGIGLGFPLSEVCFNVKYKTPSLSSSGRVSGTATLSLMNKHRPDWRFDFYSLDDRHIMAIARGPCSDALPPYQLKIWNKLADPPSVSILKYLIEITDNDYDNEKKNSNELILSKEVYNTYQSTSSLPLLSRGDPDDSIENLLYNLCCCCFISSVTTESTNNYQSALIDPPHKSKNTDHVSMSIIQQESKLPEIMNSNRIINVPIDDSEIDFEQLLLCPLPRHEIKKVEDLLTSTDLSIFRSIKK